MTGSGWRATRESRGMTLRALARAAGVSAPFLSDVEHGRRKFSPAVEAKVRAALGLAPADDTSAGPRCVVCEAKLNVIESYVPTTAPELMVYGPGSRSQFARRTTITCDHCGLVYAHAPATPSRKGREGGEA